jgi:hypothetical protein
VGQRVRRDILGDDGVARDERAAADPAELVHGDAAADEGLVPDVDMAAEHATVGEDDVRSEHAVMGDVAARHQEAVGSDEGVLTGFGRPMNRDVLAEHRAIADDRAGGGVHVEGKVLRVATDDREVVDLDAGAKRGAGLDDRMGRDTAARSERRVRFDDRERAHLDVGGESGGRMDLGGRMDHLRGEAELSAQCAPS